MKTRYEKLRLPLSRIMSAVAVFFLLFTWSHWEGRNPMITTALFTTGLILVAIGSMGRMWCAVYIAGYKGFSLITQGPYSICRNPLYLFSTFGALGIGFCTETFTFPLAFLALMLVYYPLVIRKEEQRLRESFGQEFDDYKKKVPVYFPRFSLYNEPEFYTLKAAAYRRHMFSALWFIWIVGLIELAEGLKEIGGLKPFWIIY